MITVETVIAPNDRMMEADYEVALFLIIKDAGKPTEKILEAATTYEDAEYQRRVLTSIAKYEDSLKETP